LRLRVYEKLQILVRKGFVEKAAKQYTGVEAALRAHSSKLSKARLQAEEWKATKAQLEKAAEQR